LGVLAQLAKNYSDPIVNRLAKIFIIIIGLVILVSSFDHLWIRNILAYFVAITLIIWGGRAYKNEKHAKMHNLVFSILWGSRRSYCAFLLHFSFILIANTIYIASGLSLHNNGLIAIEFMLATLAVSWIAANYLYRLVELPLRRFKL
jgi:peptidoglycan/LPS O-acetylase OafA/YrhL